MVHDLDDLCYSSGIDTPCTRSESHFEKPPLPALSMKASSLESRPWSIARLMVYLCRHQAGVSTYLFAQLQVYRSVNRSGYRLSIEPQNLEDKCTGHTPLISCSYRTSPATGPTNRSAHHGTRESGLPYLANRYRYLVPNRYVGYTTNLGETFKHVSSTVRGQDRRLPTS
jgi:hypothetical protein